MFLASIIVIHVGLSMHELNMMGMPANWSAGDHINKEC